MSNGTRGAGSAGFPSGKAQASDRGPADAEHEVLAFEQARRGGDAPRSTCQRREFHRVPGLRLARGGRRISGVGGAGDAKEAAAGILACEVPAGKVASGSEGDQGRIFFTARGPSAIDWRVQKDHMTIPAVLRSWHRPGGGRLVFVCAARACSSLPMPAHGDADERSEHDLPYPSSALRAPGGEPSVDDGIHSKFAGDDPRRPTPRGVVRLSKRGQRSLFGEQYPIIHRQARINSVNIRDIPSAPSRNVRSGFERSGVAQTGPWRLSGAGGRAARRHPERPRAGLPAWSSRPGSPRRPGLSPGRGRRSSGAPRRSRR